MVYPSKTPFFLSWLYPFSVDQTFQVAFSILDKTLRLPLKVLDSF